MGDVKHVYTVPAGEVLDSQFYSVKIEHKLVDDPDPSPFYTSYDIRYDAGAFMTAPVATALVQYIVANCEGPLAFSNTQFVGGVVRPWQPMTPTEEVMYMLSVPLGVFGQIDETAVVEVEMDRVLRIARQPTSGKRGRLELRNSLVITNLLNEDHLVSLKPSFVVEEFVIDVLTALDALSTTIVDCNLAMIGRVQTVPTIKHAAAAGEKQVWEHTMSAPLVRLISAHTVGGLGKRQVHNS